MKQNYHCKNEGEQYLEATKAMLAKKIIEQKIFLIQKKQSIERYYTRQECTAIQRILYFALKLEMHSFPLNSFVRALWIPLSWV